MFDFTRHVALSPKWSRRYMVCRALLYMCFAAAYVVFGYKTVFPSPGFFYDFKNEGSLKNTLFEPRYSENDPVIKGNYVHKSPLVFDAALIGNFSDAEIGITLDKKSPPLKTGVVEIRKSYRDFFYPIGSPIGFKDGTLITNGGSYWIISNGQRRKFPNFDAMYALGFPKSIFTPVADEELALNQAGSDVDKTEYPNGTVFKVDTDYYQLTGKQLYKFSSAKAFLSHLNQNYALTKDQAFLEKYPLSEKIIGYADGTLASTIDAIYTLSKGKAYPFDSPQTFEALGYDWNDVVKISSDELGLYEKQKTALNNQPHPDGTVFLDTQENQYYMIDSGLRLPLHGQTIVASYLKGSPIKASSKSLQVKASCTLSKDLLANRYSCTIPTEIFNAYVGNDFQFVTTLGSDLKISQMDVTFFTSPTLHNIFGSLSKLKSRLSDNYSAN